MRILGVVSSSSREVPNAPTIGTATNVGTGRAYNNGAATVTFTAPTFDGGLPITGYTVTSSPGGFTGTGAASPITVTGLQSNTAYTFTVTATNSRGTSTASAASNSITATTVPDAPTVSVADVGTARAYNNGAATVTITGGATGGSAITSYTATSTPGSFTASGSSPLTVTGLASNTAYTFSVTATNANGTSTATTSGSITATTVPQAPTIGTATAGNASATVTFTGNATGGKTVSTYTATSSPGSLTGSSATSPITVSGLTNGTAYTFTVTATNANGTSTASSASNSITPTSLYYIEYVNARSASIRSGYISGSGGYATGFSVTGNLAAGYIVMDSTGAITSQSQFNISGTGNNFIANSFIYDNASPTPYYYLFGAARQSSGNYMASYTVPSGGSWIQAQQNNATSTAGGNIVWAAKQPNGQAIGICGYWSNAAGQQYFTIGRFNNGSPTMYYSYSVDASTALSCSVDTNGAIFAVGGKNSVGTYVKTTSAGVITLQANIVGTVTSYSCANYTADTHYNVMLAQATAQTQTEISTIAIDNGTGNIAWQKKLTGFTNLNSQTSSCMDSSGNSYHLGWESGSFWIWKYNNSGTLQWQRKFVQSVNGTAIYSSLLTDGTSLFTTNDGSSTRDILRYPCDGSITGTYSYRGGTLTISAGTLTETTPTYTISTNTEARVTRAGWTPIGTVSTTTPTYAIQQKVSL